MHSKKVVASPAARLIILEGNISAGKTSLAKSLSKELGYQIFLEPTITNPYLTKFYADPKGYALIMQVWLLKQRFRTYVTALQHLLTSGGGIILDRSVFSDWVFAEKNRIDGNISPEGFTYYLNLRKQMLQTLPLPSDLVYLDVPASVCLDRVHKMRGRECESGIPIEYLEGLDQCYYAFLTYMQRKGTNVIRMPWTQFGTVQQVADELMKSKPAPVELWMRDMERLRDFVFSDEKVSASMILPAPLSLGLQEEEETASQPSAKRPRADMENEAENISTRS